MPEAKMTDSTGQANRAGGCDRQTNRALAFPVLVLLTAVLFLRPQDAAPSLKAIHLHVLCMGVCILLVYPELMREVSVKSWNRNPITACLMGVALMTILSHIQHSSYWAALITGFRFLFLVLYYMLIVVILDSTSQVIRFMSWFACILALAAGLSLLGFFELVSGSQAIAAGRLQAATGVANANVFAVELAIAIVIALHFNQQRSALVIRCGWWAALLLLAAAFLLTGSRGGLLALAGALVVYGVTRIGFGWTTLLSAGALWLLFPRLGRMSMILQSFDYGGTANSRLYLWKQGLMLFAASPISGIGSRTFRRDNLVEQIAFHNSFLECFVRLGIGGGCLFLGAFFFGIMGCCQPLRHGRHFAGCDLSGLRPCLLPVLTGFSSGLLSLSMEHHAATYVVLGLAGAYLSLASRHYYCFTAFRWTYILWIIGISGAFLISTCVMVEWIQPATTFGRR